MILAINSGSSSLKASLFANSGDRKNFRYAYSGSDYIQSHTDAMMSLINDLEDNHPTLIAHRFVHGGQIADLARLIDSNERARLQSIISLAPLHMPTNLLGVDLCAKHFNCAQIACFDTAFHSTLPELAYRLAIPQTLGLRRFGFHGINYSYISQQLPKVFGALATGKIVIAHLGSGASLCLLENMQSVDTSMGYSTAGGLTMGTRCGDIDPGVILEISRHHNAAELADLIYKKSGLLALSNNESSEMSTLERSESVAAKFAVEFFARQVCGMIGNYAAKSGGIDALIFTGGIGEHSALVRYLVCKSLGFLGFSLNFEANNSNEININSDSSKPIVIISADEESEIARLASDLYFSKNLLN